MSLPSPGSPKIEQVKWWIEHGFPVFLISTLLEEDGKWRKQPALPSPTPSDGRKKKGPNPPDPCSWLRRPGDNGPRGGHHQASLDINFLSEQLRKNPNSVLGSPGPKNFVAFDFDSQTDLDKVRSSDDPIAKEFSNWVNENNPPIIQTHQGYHIYSFAPEDHQILVSDSKAVKENKQYPEYHLRKLADIRGSLSKDGFAGGYIVLPPTVRPDGKGQYKLISGDISNIPTLSPAIVDHMEWRPGETFTGEKIEKLEIPDVEILLDALHAISPDISRNRWRDISYACKRSGVSKEQWLEWCKKSKKHNPVEDPRDWDRLTDEGDIDFRVILKEAREQGWKPEFNIIKVFKRACVIYNTHGIKPMKRYVRIFSQNDELMNNIIEYATLLRDPEFPIFDTKEQAMDFVSKKIALECNEKKTTLVLFDNGRYYKRMILTDGKSWVQNLLPLYKSEKVKAIKVDKKTALVTIENVDRIKFSDWIDYARRVFVSFEPPGCQGMDKDPYAEFINSWRGWKVKPNSDNDKIEHWLNHTHEIICCGDDVLYEWLLDYLAAMFQAPGLVGGQAIVLSSPEHGTGKGSWYHPISNILRDENFVFVPAGNKLIDRFNSDFEQSIMVVSEEGTFSGSTLQSDRLKSLITEPFQNIENKFMDSRKRPNCNHLFLLTNQDHTAIVEATDRRYAFFKVCQNRRILEDDSNNEKKRKQEYFRRVSKTDPSALLYFMLERSVNVEERVYSLPPVNTEKERQKELSLSTIDGVLYDWADTGVATAFTRDLSSDDLAVLGFDNEISRVNVQIPWVSAMFTGDMIVAICKFHGLNHKERDFKPKSIKEKFTKLTNSFIGTKTIETYAGKKQKRVYQFTGTNEEAAERLIYKLTNKKVKVNHEGNEIYNESKMPEHIRKDLL